jgi:hypothetical protein
MSWANEPMEIIECKRLDLSKPEKVPVVDKLFWLCCVLQAGGLAAGSR